MERKKKSNEQIYTLHLTKRQVELLSYACDQFSRLICGQDDSYRDLMESAWERRCKEATGKMMDKEFEGGWSNMRQDAEAISLQIKRLFWGLGRGALYGVNYDDTSDILFDLHHVLRHRLWLDKPDGEKSYMTVDADKPMRYGSEPLATIEREEEE